jgi:hypothetical protein
MPCIRIPNGILCVGGESVDLTPFGSAVWCEMHNYFGPLFTTKQGRGIVNPSAKTWAAFAAWKKDCNDKETLK